MPLATRLNGDTFRILAAEDGTVVEINGSEVATLDRSQFHEQIIDGPATITASNPVLLAQYSNGSGFDGVTSDPFMMLIPSYEQFVADYNITTPASGFAINFVNVVAPTAAVGATQIDGVAIPAGDFTAIGTSGFSGAQVAIDLGSHTLTGPLPFGAFVYGFDSYDSYGYPGGMSLSPVAIVASVSLAPASSSLRVADELCLTATVLDTNSNPVAGVRVDFDVTGANAQTGFASTDETGEAQYCYTGTVEGNDTIVASVSTLSAEAQAAWVDIVVISGTGIGKGKGGGAMGPLGLLLALPGLLWARRRRFRTGGHAILAVACAGLLGLTTTAAQAASEDWYMAISAGQVDAGYSSSDLSNDIVSLGYTPVAVSVDDTDNAVRIVGGYHVKDWLALELGYLTMGEVTSSFTLSGSGADAQTVADDLATVHAYMADGVTAAAVAFIPLGERMAITTRLGAFIWSADTTVRTAPGISAKIDDDGVDLTWGVGMLFKFTPHTGAWLQFDQSSVGDESLDLFTLGLRYRF